jgi:uncharacterized membrane protein YphA (DoxX/SURF4 family)
MIQEIFNRMSGLTAATRTIWMPWLLLAARFWFAQVLFVHQIMAMAQIGYAGGTLGAGAVHVPSSVAAMAQAIGPVLLSVGLLTRPITLLLIVHVLLGGSAINPGATGVTLSLLGWLMISGPGVLSIDHLLKRGMAYFPSQAIKFGERLYDTIRRRGTPIVLLAIRLALATSIIEFSSPLISRVGAAMFGGSTLQLHQPAWFLQAIAVLLALGVGTRVLALIFALAISGPMIAMSADSRIAIVLVVLVITLAGGGTVSLDRMLVFWLRSMTKRAQKSQNPLPHVVVVGGGFGGVAVVQGLLDKSCRITLIDQRNHHLFQPLLYQVATAALSPADIATPIREIFRNQRNVRVQLAKVTGVDTNSREVIIESGRVPLIISCWPLALDTVILEWMRGRNSRQASRLSKTRPQSAVAYCAHSRKLRMPPMKFNAMLG